MRKLTRRKAVLSSIGIGAAAIAGCVSDNPGSENGNDDEDDGNDDDSGNDDGNGDESGNNDDGTVDLSGSIERTGSDCGGPDSETAAAYVSDGAHVVEGTLPSSTPCYEPSLESTGFADGTLSLTVDVVEEDVDGCDQCTGAISYEATVEGVDPDDVDSVEVVHATGETHTIPEEEFGSPNPELVDAEITESTADSRTADDRSDVDLDEVTDLSGEGVESVEIAGTILTSTPAHEAVLEDASVEGTELQLAVGVESTLEDDEMEPQVEGIVSYTATVELRNGDALQSVTVEHPESSHGAAWESDSSSASASTSGSSGSSSGSSESESDDEEI